MDEARLQAGAPQGLDGLAEAVELQRKVPVVRDVGGGKVREGAGAFQPAMEVDGATQLHGVGATHADARHAGVDRQVIAGDAVRSGGGLAKRQGKVGRVDRRHQVVLHERAHAVDGRLGEHEDRPLDARLAQRHALGDRGHRKLARAGGVHDLHARNGAVPVGVRLDDAHELDAALEPPPEGGGVSPQRRKVDLDP